MTDAWMPGLVHDPGTAANYQVGRNRMELVKVHFTAGVNSYDRCKTGAGTPWGITLCQFLLPKVGVPWQFAPADALCYDSGDFNDDGPGIEIERLGTGDFLRDGLQRAEQMTPDQTQWFGAICRWLHTEHGVPLELYAGPRFQIGGFRGFVNHGDIDPSRSDGVTPDEWVTAVTGITIPQEDTDMAGSNATFLVEGWTADPADPDGNPPKSDNGHQWFLTNGVLVPIFEHARQLYSKPPYNIPSASVSLAVFNQMRADLAALAAPGGGGDSDGITDAQVAAIVDRVVSAAVAPVVAKVIGRLQNG